MSQGLDLFDPSCPSGGKWYACAASSENKSPFVGCCKADPCNLNGCALGNLAPVSFNASAYGTVPDPSCGASSTFYSCVNVPTNDTTFWGCCKSNPCNLEDPNKKECPSNNLTPAVLDTASLQSAYGTEAGGDTKEHGHSHTGVIVGATVGGVVAVVAIIAILIFCLKKRRAKSRPSSSSNTAPPQQEKTEFRHSALSEALPTYGSPRPPPFAAFNNQHGYTQVSQSTPQELPSDFVTGSGTQRYSELPAGSPGLSPQGSPGIMQHPVELESPTPSPFVSPRLGTGTAHAEAARPGSRGSDTTYRVSMGGLGLQSPKAERG